MTKWLVFSPVYLYHEIVVDGQGPWYEERDVVEVEAESAADARVLGLRLLRKLPTFHKYDDNPFNGITVQEQP